MSASVSCGLTNRALRPEFDRYARRMGPRIGALVLFASDLERTVAFYRVLGVPLHVDDHGEDEGPLHCTSPATSMAVTSRSSWPTVRVGVRASASAEPRSLASSSSQSRRPSRPPEPSGSR